MGVASSIMMGFTTASEALSGASGARAEGEYRQRQAEINARLAEKNADEIVASGDKAANQLKKKARQIRGSQRVALAARGLDINTGSAAEIQDDTELQSKLDIHQIKNNALRRAWGYKVEASRLRSEGRLARINANYKSDMTLLTGGIQLASTGMDAFSEMTARLGGGGDGDQSFALDVTDDYDDLDPDSFLSEDWGG